MEADVDTTVSANRMRNFMEILLNHEHIADMAKFLDERRSADDTQTGNTNVLNLITPAYGSTFAPKGETRSP
jgi:hypothetical protein